MVLLAAKPLSEYPEGVWIPEEEIHNGMFYERGITSHAEIVRLWDERRDNETSWQLRRTYRPTLCPKCSHRSWTKRLLDQDAVRCRWGHVTSRLEILQAERGRADGPTEAGDRPVAAADALRSVRSRVG